VPATTPSPADLAALRPAAAAALADGLAAIAP
jgi:hypothetical protein